MQTTSELYSTLANIKLPDANVPNFDFRYWHTEALLMQGTLLIQRAVDERSDLFALLYQRDLIADQILKEQNELDSLNTKKEGSLLRESQYSQFEYDRRCVMKAKFDRVHAMARQAYGVMVTEEHDAWIQSSSIDIDMNVLNADIAIYRKMGVDQDLTATVNYLDSEYKRLTIKKNQFEVLDLQSRIDSLSGRIVTDFKEALSRLVPASKGLEIFFGFEFPLPDAIAKTDFNSWNVFDALIDWARKANTYLAQFSENDQIFTKRISLNSLLFNGNSEDLKNALQNKNILTFWLDKNFFSHSFLRIRGISAYVIQEEESDDSWELHVSVPERALIKNQNSEFNFLKQKFPTVQLGRVSHLNHPIAAEVVGGVSVGNASPISNSEEFPWKVEIIQMAVSRLKCKKCSMMLPKIKCVWCEQLRRAFEA